MARVGAGRPGRPAAATREDVLALAGARFLAGERVDMQGIARELGLARATMHRWFGTREVLLGETLALLAETRLAEIRAEVGGSGPAALLECFDRFTRELASLRALRCWLAQEQERGLRILTSSGGIVQPRMVTAAKRLIEAEIRAGALQSRISTSTLAYATVRLVESFLYNDAMFGIRGDVDRMHEVAAALLGVG